MAVRLENAKACKSALQHYHELLDQMKDAMAGLLDPELRETVIGHAEVKQLFQLSRGIVAGCPVTDGRIARVACARILRKRQPVYDGGISTLRRFQDDVKEVRSGPECGIKLGDFSEYQVGDVIECYQLEQSPRNYRSSARGRRRLPETSSTNMKHRQRRVNELVKRELSGIISREINFEGALVSINAVDVASDLKSAHVFVSTLGVAMAAA